MLAERLPIEDAPALSPAPGPRRDVHSIAVFGKNEAQTIGPCLKSIAVAATGLTVQVTIILNGTTDNSLDVARATLCETGLPATVYTIPVGDKSNAINAFLYRLRPQADIYHFVDAYVRIGPSSFRALAGCLQANPEALAAGAVPSTGGSAQLQRQRMLEGGAFSGQLFALRPAFIDTFTAKRLRLPFGLYRGDGLLVSMACHSLDALHRPWETSRIVASPEATFEIPRGVGGKSLRQFPRMIRQARGKLESEAVKSIIYRQGYEALADNCDDMLRMWMRDNPLPKVPLADRVLRGLALMQHRRARKPHADELAPRVAFSSAAAPTPPGPERTGS